MEVRAAGDVVYVVDAGVLDGAAVAAFTLGQCHGLALAVHERMGWPMVATYNADGACQHVLVEARTDRFIDIAGARSRAELLAEANFHRVAPIDRAGIHALTVDEGWAAPEPAAAQPWLEEVIARGLSGAEAIASTFLGRSISEDDEMEVVFRWGGTEYIDVLLRRPGARPAASSCGSASGSIQHVLALSLPSGRDAGRHPHRETGLRHRHA